MVFSRPCLLFMPVIGDFCPGFLAHGSHVWLRTLCLGLCLDQFRVDDLPEYLDGLGTAHEFILHVKAKTMLALLSFYFFIIQYG